MSQQQADLSGRTPIPGGRDWLPSYTPVTTQLFLELCKATGIKAGVIDGGMDFPEHGTAFMTMRVLVTEEMMNEALSAIAAKRKAG